MFSKNLTLSNILQIIFTHLQNAGVEKPRFESELILSYILNTSRPWLLSHMDEPFKTENKEKLEEWIIRRQKREPLTYLIGKKEFFSLDFEVSQAVLIPRPETELLVEETLRMAAPGKENFSIVDLGTGSGCIAITLAKHLSKAEIYAVDISEQALQLAQKNAKNHGVEDRINWILGDFRSLELQKKLPVNLNVILSNPPYVESDELQFLAPELSYEPRIALDGGSKGIDYYPFLIQFAGKNLRPSGHLLMEIGENQEPLIRPMFENIGSWEIKVIQDLYQRPRVISGKKIL